MSASRKGKQIQNKIERVQRQGDTGVVTHDIAEDRNERGYTVAPPSQLPRKYQASDPNWDNEVELKRQLMVESNGPDTRFGTIQFTDRDARALLAKKKATEAAKFDGWFGERFNTADLPTRLLGEQLNPEYYQEREETLVQKADLALRIELMKLYGPRSEEDLMILYGLQTGYLRLDKDWNRIGYNTEDGVTSAANRHRGQRELMPVSRFFMNQANVRNHQPSEASLARPQDTPFLQADRGIPISSFAQPQELAGTGPNRRGLSNWFNFLRAQQ